MYDSFDKYRREDIFQSDYLHPNDTKNPKGKNTTGQFVVRNLENHLNHIDFFLVKIIMILNLFRE